MVGVRVREDGAIHGAFPRIDREAPGGTEDPTIVDEDERRAHVDR
jgi:hypothetical protein